MQVVGYEGEYLSKEDILLLHEKIIKNSESKDSEGFIDQTGALFDSAVNGIFSSFFGVDAYPTIEEKAARLCYNIITSHVFCNANKRTGMLSMIQLLDLNEMPLKYTNDEMFEVITRVGSGECTYEELHKFVSDRIIRKTGIKKIS